MKESITTNREITRKIHILESPPEIGYQAAPPPELTVLLPSGLSVSVARFSLSFSASIEARSAFSRSYHVTQPQIPT